MSHTTSFTRGQSRFPLTGAPTSIRRALSNVARSWKRRRQLVHAAELDDHLLADIGLSRDQLQSALPFTAYNGNAALRLLRTMESGRS